jgi:sugar lactone lactonase YvrE
LAVLALVAASAASPAPGTGFVDRFKAATAAYEAKDYARMETELRAALLLRPAHPTASYNLAAALALRGERGKAVAVLDTLADAGLVFDPAADADFAALKGDREFTSVRRAFARNGKPRGEAARAFRLRSTTFIPEGIAWDPKRRHFYLGSVHERRIQKVLRDDSEVDFIKPGAGLWAVFGMAVDSRRDLLWVASAAVPEMRDAAPAELGRSALLAYDLESREQKHRFVLDDGPGPHALGDLVVLRDGTVYASDSRAGMLYALDPASGKFTAATKPGELSSPQGLVLSRDRRALYVADYTQGLYRFDLESRALTRLEADPEVCVYGIDGLALHDDALIAIQNGIRPHRVVRLRLSDRGRRVASARVLAASLREFEEPTLGAVVDDDFYFIANSQWNRFDKDHKLPPAEQLRRPLVLRIALEGDRAPRSAEPSGPASQPRPALPLPCVPGVSC